MRPSTPRRTPASRWRTGGGTTSTPLWPSATASPPGTACGWEWPPLGDPDLCYDGQYSDAALWLAQGGYVDYLMPQLYWGLTYTQDGDTAHSLDTLAARWAALPRDGGVALYVGLGAYRIGDGDGSTAGAAEWQSGHALADQLDALESLGIGGVGLYRYASLWENTGWPDLAQAERQALAARWVTDSPGY